MKAEQRKELQTNSLVRFVGRLGHGFKSNTSRRTAVVWGIVLLALVVFIGWRIVAGISERKNSRRWLELDMASAPGDLETLIKQNKGTVQANVARLLQARQDLKDGLTELYSNYEAASEKLKQAAGTYDHLAKRFKNTPILMQECMLGAGKAHEGLGELDEALSRYEDLANRNQDSALAQEAGKRADYIKSHRAHLESLNAALKKLSGGTTTVKKP